MYSRDYVLTDVNKKPVFLPTDRQCQLRRHCVPTLLPSHL